MREISAGNVLTGEPLEVDAARHLEEMQQRDLVDVVSKIGEAQNIPRVILWVEDALLHGDPRGKDGYTLRHRVQISGHIVVPAMLRTLEPNQNMHATGRELLGFDGAHDRPQYPSCARAR